ncbi:MAG: glycosyltransferase [Planctomycetaceae bacterium]|nr:MAG: glycosyltransferase [Planctomycetaceae bacterium]
MIVNFRGTDCVRIALFPLGSAGDVHPFLGLGQALKNRGHHVAIMVNGYFQQQVQRIGLEHYPLGTAEEFLTVTRDPNLWRPVRSFGSVFRHGIHRAMREQYAVVEEHFADRSTLLLSNCLSFGVRIAAEKFGLPLLTVHIQPAPLWSEHRSPVLPCVPSGLPRWCKRLVFRLGQRLVIDRTVCPATNRFRRELGLPPMRRTLDWWNSPGGVLCLFPEWYAPVQPDWPQPLWFSQFPMWDESDQRSDQAEVSAFLDGGDPPLVFAPGSANCQARPFFAAAVDACQRLNRRGVLVSPFADQIPHPLPATVRHFQYVPFSRLLPRAAALVHHGGIGTTAQGLRAGLCHLVMPMAHDQPDNADRLARLGVGDWIRPRHFRGSTVAAALDRLLRSQRVADRCQQIANRFTDVDPFAESCRVVESA